MLVIAAGGVYAAANRGLIPAKYLGYFGRLGGSKQYVTNLMGSTRSQIDILSSKAVSTASQSGVVLGSTVEAKKEQPPLPQRAFELGRYTYCQEVIRDYENRFPTTEN